ncbi:MAG: acyltransferase family protein [Thiothrix sp.]
MKNTKQLHLLHPEYRSDIDGLRAVAILSVLAYHAFPLWFPGGFIGVDIFFVISGFLISTIIFKNLEQGRFSFIEFYARRVRRIFPALIVVLVFVYSLGWISLFADEYKQLGKHIAAGAGFVSNFILWDEVGYFDNSAETKPLLHLWSLGIEEQFYLVWPLLIWFAWKNKLNLFSLIVFVIIISFLFNLSLIQKSPTSTFYFPQTRFWELLCGSLLAWLTLYKNNIGLMVRKKIDRLLGIVIYQHPPDSNGRIFANVLSFSGAILLGYGFYKIHKDFYFPGAWAVIPVLGAVLLVASGPSAWFNKNILSNRVMVWFGLISFPLYLWHWPLLSFARILESELPRLDIRLIIVLVSVILAWLTYKLIEQPIRSGQSNTVKLLTLVFAMMLVGFIGYNTYHRNGLTFREAEKIKSINSFDSVYRETCESLTQDFYVDDWCNKGTSSEHSINTVMIGDSFSNAYTPMLTAYSKNIQYDLSYIQFARGQCPSILDYGPGYCKEMANKTLEYIKNSPNIKTVIISSSWSEYYNGKIGFSSMVTHEETGQSFKESFERTLHAYQSLGKKIVVLLSPPMGSNPRSCVTRKIRITDTDKCNLPIEVARAYDGTYRDYMIPLLNSLNIQFFDPFKYFCNETECKITDDGQIFSIDGRHLSVFGGEYLEKKARSDLYSLLNK